MLLLYKRNESKAGGSGGGGGTGGLLVYKTNLWGGFLLGFTPIIYMNETKNMFTYGTLMNDEIRFRVLGKDTTKYPAELADYELKNHSYAPYLVVAEKKGSVVKGVMFKADKQDIQRLDRYENGLYDRIVVNIKGVECFTYIERKLSPPTYK